MQELTRLLSSDKGVVCINERDDCVRTSVDCAIIGQKLECLKLLLDKGADQGADANCDGRTPLFYAASRSLF